MTYIHWQTYKGGVNNLCVARDSKTGTVATSIKGKERAILNLDHKITLRRMAEKDGRDKS